MSRFTSGQALLFLCLLASPGLVQAQPEPSATTDEERTLYWSMERLLLRSPNPDAISLDLKPSRVISVQVPGATYNVNTVAEILEVLSNDRYRVRVGQETKIYRGADLRRLNLPYLLTDGSRVLAGSSKNSGAILKVDRARDPALREFLAEAERIAKRPLTTEATKLRKVMDLVNSRIKYPGSEAPNRQPYDKLEAEHKGKEVHFGEYFKIGQGVCRHKALAMKLALEAMGYPSRYVAGQALSRATGDVRGGHAWVEAISKKGRRLMIDPTWHDPGIAMKEAYNKASARRPKPGAKRIIPPGEKLPTFMGDLTADMLEPYRRQDGTVDWKRLTQQRVGREVKGLGHFTLALFLKELASVAATGDKLRIEEFFDALMTTDFYKEYGLFALGARAGEVAYVRYLQRFVRPRFVNGILKTNLVLATGLALPQLVNGTFEGKAFAISLGSLGLSSSAVKAGVRGLTWVKELSSAKRVGTAARIGTASRLAKVGGFLYTAAELAVVLYLADEIDHRVNAYLDERAAKDALADAGEALFNATRDPAITPTALGEALETYHAAWDAHRDYLYRPLLAEDARLAQRLEKSAEAAKLVADRRSAALTRVNSKPALSAALARRYGSIEAYADHQVARDEAAIQADVEAALAHYERARAQGIEDLYQGERRSTPYLSGVDSLDYLATGKNDPWGTRGDIWAERGRASLGRSFREALRQAPTNKLQTYDDEARALALVKRAFAGRPEFLDTLRPIETRLARQRELDEGLAGGSTSVELREGVTGALQRSGR